MNRLRTLISPVFCMSLLASPMLQAGALAADSPDQRAASAAASLPPGVIGETIEPDKLVIDFRLARQALQEGHSGIYRYTAKEKLDGLFDRAEKSLKRPMNAVDFYRILAPVVAAIKCGHTGVGLPEEMQKAYSTKALLLPLQIRVLAGKVYILRDFSDGATTLAGREIRSINGIPAAKIVQTILAATPGDGDSQTCRISRMNGWTFARRFPALLGVHSPYEVTVWDAKDNREDTVHLEGKELPRLQEAPRPVPTGSASTDGGRVQADGRGQDRGDEDQRIRRLRGFRRKKSLREFYRESFEAMSESGTKSLILDLRDNGGGEDELGKLLLSYLLDQPFKYYDDLVINARQFSFQKYTDSMEPLPADLLAVQPDGKYRMVKHPNWGMQQPSKPPFRGKVLILINGGSFSTTSEFLSHAHFHKRATFIGEESGGGYYGNTSGPSLRLTLPHSKVQVGVPLMTYYMAVSGYQAKAHGVLPDYPIEYTIEELLAGEDKELALAFELARKS